MLVLSRRMGEEIVVPELGLTICVIQFRDGNKVRLGITAPAHLRVFRREVWERMDAPMQAAVMARGPQDG